MASCLTLPSLSTSFDEYIARLKTDTDATISSSRQLPEDIPFHRSLDRKFRTDLDATSTRLLKLTNRLLRLTDTLNSKPGKKRVDDDYEEELKDEIDVLDKFHSVVVDVVDPLLEHVDHCLDVHSGRIKPVAEKSASQPSKNTRLPQSLLHSAALEKPQLNFLDSVDNSNGSTWSHHLKKKWHANVSSRAQSTVDMASTHPYFYEISHIVYPPTIFSPRAPIEPKSFEDTPFTYVDGLPGLQRLLSQLRQAEEIAIDLEHHSYRSYHGFVCLMQISTRNEDWIVDTLIPEIRANLEDLNEVFTDPKITKVLHGAHSDIVWLQENFNLYIVNLFDTYHASQVLGLPRHSLAFLLSAYCDFQADKRYQLADWRIRPLPEDMLHYARSDTHFLLFIYDQLREALLEKGLNQNKSASPVTLDADDDDTSEVTGEDEMRYVRKVLKRSEKTALKEFAREQYDQVNGEGIRGWASLLRKWNKRALMVDGIPRSVFMAVHAWRDQVAREEDESPLYVISNQALLTLVEKPPPKDLMALYSSFTGVVPPIIRKRGVELLKVVKDAVEHYQSTSKSLKRTKNVTKKPEEKADTSMADVYVDIPKHVVFSAQAVPVPGLWAATPLSDEPAAVPKRSIVAASSSLFGPSANMSGARVAEIDSQTDKKPAGKLSTRSSALFAGFSPSPISAPLSHSKDGKVEAVITRIHQNILRSEKKVVVVAKQPTPKDTSKETSTVANMAIEPPNGNSKASSNQTTSSEARAEIAFVPRAQRPLSTQEEDEIIIVGQRKKKRKRTEGELETEGKKKKTKELGLQEHSLIARDDRERMGSNEEPAVFDYSTVPNLLDKTVQEDREGQRKGQRNRKSDRGTKLDFGGFGRAPKRTNEPKSGNKSFTFR